MESHYSTSFVYPDGGKANENVIIWSCWDLLSGSLLFNSHVYIFTPYTISAQMVTIPELPDSLNGASGAQRETLLCLTISPFKESLAQGHSTIMRVVLLRLHTTTSIFRFLISLHIDFLLKCIPFVYQN